MFIKISLIIFIGFLIYFIVKLITSKKEIPTFQSIDFETRFTVTEIIDGDTFKISPGWKWNKEKGDTIRPTGYNTPEQGNPGYQETKEKLEQLLLNKEVELKKPVKLSYNQLLCNVYFNGKNLAEFFPDYKT